MIIVINLYLTRSYRALTEYEESRAKTEEEEATTSHGIRVNFLMNDGNTTIPDDIDYKVFGLDDDDDVENDSKKDVDNDQNPWSKEAADTTTDERPPEETMTDHLKALAKVEMSNDKGY